MSLEIPSYALKAFALFYSKYSTIETFTQSELDWVVGQSMKKKIFSVLLNAGWIEKVSRTRYKCIEPQVIFKELLSFKVPDEIKKAQKKYAFTNLSAMEIWSDFSYVQRSIARSPYYIKILKSDMTYWKNFFNKLNINNYVGEGHSIGEFVILIPVDSINSIEKDGVFVDTLQDTLKFAMSNESYKYVYEYMREKYGAVST